MCLIIDINIAHKVMLKSDDAEFKDVHSSLFHSKPLNARLVYGGKLADEYKRNSEIRRLLIRLDQAGRAKQISDEEVDQEMKSILKMGQCKSNDHHIIALARVANVRLLCSHDGDLHADFTNKKLLDRPRGKIYKNIKHNHLLRGHCS